MLFSVSNIHKVMLCNLKLSRTRGKLQKTRTVAYMMIYAADWTRCHSAIN